MDHDKIQNTLDMISNNLIDPESWRIIVKDQFGCVVAETRAIIQVKSIARLLSLEYPEVYVEIRKHNLARRIYRSGSIVDESERPELLPLLPSAGEDQIESWKHIK